jgi:hypothetical protein
VVSSVEGEQGAIELHQGTSVRCVARVLKDGRGVIDESGRFHGLKNVFNKIKLAPNDRETLITLGHILWKKQDFTGSRSCFEAVIE